MSSISETSRVLDVAELALLFELRNLGCPRGQAEVPEELLPTLRIKLGSASEPPGEHSALDGQPSALIDDDNTRRRIVRRLCQKLANQGKWAPAAMLGPAIARGFPDDERGQVRESIEILRKASWLVVPVQKRIHGELLYALNPEFRAEITALVTAVRTALPSVLEQWFAEG